MVRVIREVTQEEHDEFEFASLQGRRLMDAVRFLIENGATDELIEAVAQAALDNTNYIDESLSFEGTA